MGDLILPPYPHRAHIETPCDGYTPLTWIHPGRSNQSRVRVRDYSCGCGYSNVVYELCASGGLMFIRRSIGLNDVRETERWPTSHAEVMWRYLFAGRIR